MRRVVLREEKREERKEERYVIPSISFQYQVNWLI